MITRPDPMNFWGQLIGVEGFNASTLFKDVIGPIRDKLHAA
jgi:hypothetical protein